jgi:hypothetical protein
MAHCLLSFFLILPEIRLGAFMLKPGDLFLFASYIKDAPLL